MTRASEQAHLPQAELGALAALTRSLGERELYRHLAEIAGSVAGADGAALLTRRPRRLVHSRAHRLRRPRGGMAAEEASPEIAELLEKGHPATLFGERLKTFARSFAPDIALAVLIPCAGPGSTAALLVEWRGPAAPPDADTIDRLRLVALVAGQTLARLDAEHREHLARAETENRIKNTVAVVRSIALRSARPAASLEEFSLHFEGRLDAVARVQMAFTRSGPRVQLEELVEEELFSQGIEEGPNVSIHGMPMPLDGSAAETLCLAFHELAVNAVKYGAFAESGGSLTLRWWLEMAGEVLILKIRWAETTRFPTDPHPTHYGFGRTLLERLLPFELDARTRLVFGEQGMRCEIAMPVPNAGPSRQRLATGFPLRQTWRTPHSSDG